MRYENIKTGEFLSRPNRFIAKVKVDGAEITCHVKNTGRCRELLLPGVTVILEYFPEAKAAGRKTEYDLIAVYKDKLLINMDSQAPNRAAWEWLCKMEAKADGGRSGCGLGTGLFGPDLFLSDLRREVTHGDSRFDLAFTLKSRRDDSKRPALMEVKGVTLEENGLVRFPDAPTERGVKHLHGLIRAHKEGFEAYVLFVIQMKRVRSFSPNDATHPAFGQALREAAAAGVHILAYDCIVTPDSMNIDSEVPVVLETAGAMSNICMR